MQRPQDRIDRSVELELLDRLAAEGSTVGDLQAGVGRTTDLGAYPTSSPGVFALLMASATADEDEGAAVTIDVGAGAVVYAINLTTTVPDVGVDVIYTKVGDRFFFAYYGPARA